MYLDPGFGGMLVQIIIALVAGGGAILFAMRKKISLFFSKRKDHQDLPPASSQEEFDADLVDTIDEDTPKR